MPVASFKSLYRKLKRGVRQMWYWDIWHWQPSAPFHWRYFLPRQSSRIRLFRALWWHSRYKLPGLLWLPLALFRVMHWRLFAADRRLKRAMASYSESVEARFGIPANQQRERISYWAKTWCIDPYQAYQWQLYRVDADGLAIIYENQTAAYHALQNRRTGASKADHRLLGDKIALAERLTKQGIPLVATASISNGDWRDFQSALAAAPRLFCKLRSGNQGQSAFAVWRDQHGFQGQELAGTILKDEAAIKQAWQTLCAHGQVLIQPLLENHPNFAMAAVDQAVFTLRIVTRVGDQGIAAWWAELQVPAKGEGRGFWRFPVSITNGDVSALGRDWFLKQAWQDEYDALWQELSGLNGVPYWQAIVEHSLVAHRQLPKVWAIAWDWVITANGPVLLEGNSGWALSDAQQQGVVFLPSS